MIRMLSPGSFLASIDLEDAYLLLPIHPEDRKYLRFRFRNQLFQFTVLPFGLASAPYIFTKILKPVVYSLRRREKGFLSVVYLDDFLIIAQSYDQCTANVSTPLNLLSALGFAINTRKSALIPATSCRFLGFIFNTQSFAVSIPPDKRLKLLQKTLTILDKRKCKIHLLASFIGSLVSVCPAVKYGILHTKTLEREFLALSLANDNFESEMTITRD